MLPIVDLAPLLSGGDAGRRRVAAEIGAACRGPGFFYVRNHGVPAALVEATYAVARLFFALPDADKQRVSIARSGNNRGYAGPGSESLDPRRAPDLKEAFNIGADPTVGARGELEAALSATPWPMLPGFAGVTSRYFAALRRLGEQLHTAFATDLGLEADFFAPYIDRPMATLRLLRYPPHPDPGPRGAGAGEHTDYGNLTILSQDDVGGLEVRQRDGAWIAAPPIAGSFICNIGDCLMRWSNDVYVSTPHRVSPHVAQERASIAFFFDPNADAPVTCLPGCTGADRPARYAPITAVDHLRERLDATYAHRRPTVPGKH